MRFPRVDETRKIDQATGHRTSRRLRQFIGLWWDGVAFDPERSVAAVHQEPFRQGRGSQSRLKNWALVQTLN